MSGLKITLKAARVNAGLTQPEAAVSLKVSKSTIINWEKGRSFPNTRQIQNIERLYQITYDSLVFLPQNNAKSVIQ